MTKKVHLNLGSIATYCGQTRGADTEKVSSAYLEDVTCEKCRRLIKLAISSWSDEE